jgi:hypothetical protein
MLLLQHITHNMFSLNIIKVMIEAAIYRRVPIADNFNIFLLVVGEQCKIVHALLVCCLEKSKISSYLLQCHHCHNNEILYDL